ncbi:hypothetical protein PROFUN_16262, partial [Planoprotostelium fungivorum]
MPLEITTTYMPSTHTPKFNFSATVPGACNNQAIARNQIIGRDFFCHCCRRSKRLHSSPFKSCETCSAI